MQKPINTILISLSQVTLKEITNRTIKLIMNNKSSPPILNGLLKVGLALATSPSNQSSFVLKKRNANKYETIIIAEAK
jgi:hypothetical protein